MQAYALLLGFGALALVGYFQLPEGGHQWAYDAIGLICAGALGWRAKQARHGRNVWVLFASGLLLWVLADLLLTILTKVEGGVEPFPSAADALYLAGYPVIAAALVAASRTRGRPGGLGPWIEGAIITIAAAVPLWTFFVWPALSDTSAGTLTAVIGAAYPAMDLLLIGAAVQLGFAGSGRLVVAALLLLGIASTLVADVVYNVESLAGTYLTGDPVDAGWLLGYLFWGAAALHPSAERLLERVEPDADAATHKRTAVIIATAVVLLGTVGIDYINGTSVDVALVLGALAAITVLIAIRLRGLAVERASGQWRGTALLYSTVALSVVLAVALTEVRAGAERRMEATQALQQARVQTERAERLAARGDVGSARSTLGLVSVDVAEAELRSYARALAGEGDRVSAHAALSSKLAEEVRRSDSSVVAQGRAGRVVIVVMLAFAAFLLGVLALRFGAARRAFEREQERLRVTQDSEQSFRALIRGSADVITVIAADTTVLAHPESIEGLFGLEPGTLIGTHLSTHLRPEDMAATHAALAELAGHPGEMRSLEWKLTRPDETTIDVEVSVTDHLHDPRLGGFVLNLRDVSYRKRLEAALQHQAFHDHLTGLANRALLEDRLRTALARTAREPAVVALLYLDLDDFKMVNDSLGHPVGDALLVEVARRLQLALRASDTLARMGGDEFAVLIEGLTSVDEATATARRLLRAMREPITLPSGDLVVGASIGMAVGDGGSAGSPSEQTARLLRNADLAMYEAKRLGGGSLEVFAPEMHDAVSSRLQLKSELRHALDRGEFIVHYQPIVSLSSGTPVGFEALARWQHPKRGLLQPGSFIDAAEQTGLIVELGAQVLREASRQVAAWNLAHGTEHYISVNVAGAQLMRESFADEVRETLTRTGLPAHLLVLEVTETALIQDSEGNRGRMSQLRELGVRLAIDDFGTGYSSLNYLRRFPMDVLKIDKSFIDRVAVPGREQALVEAMIAMGRSLDLKVIAEGIEEREQADALHGRSCALGQGYLFAKPLAPGDVDAYLDQAPQKTLGVGV